MSDHDELLSKKITIKKTRILHRRNNRMKIQFNLSEQEAVAFKNFYDAVNTNGISEEDFTKSAFMIGLQQMERIIIEKTMEAHKKAAEEEAGAEPEIVEEETNETEETEE
jgi:hypothetical protein